MCDSIFQALTNITDLKEKISLASVNSDIDEMPDTQVSAFPTLPLNTAPRSVIPPHSSPVQTQLPENIDYFQNNSPSGPCGLNFGFIIKDISDEIKRFDVISL